VPEVLSTLLVVVIFLGVALYAMNGEERVRFARATLAAILYATEVVTLARPEHATFRSALRERTRWALVTAVIVALNAAIFALMYLSSVAVDDPETLVAWGGTFGPRTSNGEWWRLVTALFVHSGTLHLLASLAGLVPLGLVLERLVGPFTFATTYLAAGVLAGLVSLAVYPVAVFAGASGAIFGMYGLLLATLIRGGLLSSTVRIPLRAVKTLGPAAAVFILYNIATDGLPIEAELAGFFVGFACGVAMMNDVSERKPAPRHVAIAALVTAVIATASAVLLRGVADVRPEIARVVALEQRIAGAYQTAVKQFTAGRTTAKDLTQLIAETIRPELQTARARLNDLVGVPADHQALIASADEYLRLRDESWRLRIEGLHEGDMRALREADKIESASLKALQRTRPAAGNLKPTTPRSEVNDPGAVSAR
jgi:membrane associated rhomboid family serine protease